jgi:PPM family protein phosphatase
MSQYKIEAGTGQHIGDRKEQQDRAAIFAAPNYPGCLLAVVADGMGGKSGGALAAEQVVRTSKLLIDEFNPTDDVKTLLTKIIEETHMIIKLSGFSAQKEPHSTVVALLITPDRKATWAWAGDSRLYRFVGPNYAEKTKDHSYVERLVDEGKIAPEDAKDHPMSNILVNVLGSHANPPYVTFGDYENLAPGDSFLLCTDGLWHYFSDPELSAIVAANSPRQGSELLIKKARERASGQGDNCTFAIIKVTPPPEVAKTYVAKSMRSAT